MDNIKHPHPKIKNNIENVKNMILLLSLKLENATIVYEYKSDESVIKRIMNRTNIIIPII